ncbi:MAG: hypothetical protein U0547_04925 [Dehalococcoidia bacterium]
MSTPAGLFLAMMILLAGLGIGALGETGSAEQAVPVRAVAPMVARDGPPPPAPTPTPIPPPPAIAAKPARCFEPRGDVSAFDVRPADGDSVLRNCQVIAYYGYPGVPGLGVLGEGSEAEMLARLAREVAAYDEANGGRHAVGGLHLIAAVAQAGATADGSWLVRMPWESIDHQLALAEANDLVVILDVQMGHSTVAEEIPRLLPYLSNPRVHLAVDPEWAMPPGVAPGTAIGGMDASAINEAQRLMSEYIAAHGLSNRMLIVHQFTPGMIRNKAGLQWYAGVDLVIDMDGFGGQGIKLAHYDQFVREDGAPHGGLKLFYDEDVNLLAPWQVAAISPQPDVVIFQ